MKAQITLIEMIVVLIALFVAFGVFFTSFGYKNKWKEANILLMSRDLILTINRIGKIYEYSFNQSGLSQFLNSLIKENLIPWSEVEGTITNRIVVACNCTEDEINKMYFWFNPLFLNNRKITLLFLKSNLEEIPPETNVLLIKGYKYLSTYSKIFNSYITRGIGIVELMDFDAPEKVNNDETQKKIFGLSWNGTEQGTADMIFLKPISAKNLTYIPYKYFYHVPLTLNIFSEDSLPGCSSYGKGNFKLNGTSYTFWICDATHVWFDTNADGVNDTLVSLGGNFNISKYNFTLKYIYDNSSISVSFKTNYTFSNYFSYEQAGNKYIANIIPIDGDEKRVLLKAVKGGKSFPTVILNFSRVAWMYDFGENPSDEEKELLLSLLLWASSKKSVVLDSPMKTGFSTSYINVENKDVFEVYKFSLGLSYPY
jgi:hypothetical protein